MSENQKEKGESLKDEVKIGMHDFVGQLDWYDYVNQKKCTQLTAGSSNLRLAINHW
ncbi:MULTISPECIES: hypothetical protein [Marinifilum]|uniref:hypothetical protein n=1 Tax=Marinifilum TaxID=866673 RepID=UPI00249186FF|nr:MULTISPECIES: hypothetical protein [Marinifilum]